MPLIGEEDRAFSGGSDVMVQEYLLDLDGAPDRRTGRNHRLEEVV
jgi:hypothetical protein